MKLYYLRFSLYLFSSILFKLNIFCFNCCLSEKNDIKYVEINLQSDTQKIKSEKLNKILKQNNLNEKTNVNLIGNEDKDQSKDEKDKLNKENEIIEKLEKVFLNNGRWLNIDEIDIKNINEYCDVLPKDLFIYYDGTGKIVVSKNEQILKDYFKEKNKDKENINIEELRFEGLTRVELGEPKDEHEKYCLSDFKKKLLGVNNDDCGSILYIIFKVGKEDNIITRDIKFDMNIYCKKK